MHAAGRGTRCACLGRRGQEHWEGGPHHMRGMRIALAAALGVLVLTTLLVAFVVLAPFGGGAAREVLASDQTLSFPIAQDVADFDPAQISNPGDIDVLRNVFSGLYKF